MVLTPSNDAGIPYKYISSSCTRHEEDISQSHDFQRGAHHRSRGDRYQHPRQCCHNWHQRYLHNQLCSKITVEHLHAWLSDFGHHCRGGRRQSPDTVRRHHGTRRNCCCGLRNKKEGKPYRFHFKYASTKRSSSPSRTPAVSLVSTSVRKSFTIW